MSAFNAAAFSPAFYVVDSGAGNPTTLQSNILLLAGVLPVQSL